LSSLSGSDKRLSSSVEISVMRWGLANFGEDVPKEIDVEACPVWINSSTMVFHSLHELH